MSTPEEYLRRYGAQMPPPVDSALPGMPGAMGARGAMAGNLPGQTPGQNPIDAAFAQLSQGMPQRAPSAQASTGAPGSQAEDAQIAALLGTAGEQMGLDEMISQRDRIQALRDANVMPEMRSAGRVSVAANPLEFIAKGVKDYRLSKKERDLTEGAKDKTTGQRTGGIKGGIESIGGKIKDYGGLIFKKKDEENA